MIFLIYFAISLIMQRQLLIIWKVNQKIFNEIFDLSSMKYVAICIVVFVFSLCVSQPEPIEDKPEISVTPVVTAEPTVVPDDVLDELIRRYFNALNQRDLTTLQSLTHPFYSSDVNPFLDYVVEHNLSFDIVSLSFLMDEIEFREMTEVLSDEEFKEQVGLRGVSYEIELYVTKGTEVFEGFYLFVELGETEDGWKILDPGLLQLVIEGTLEVFQSEE
jgi:hypothetical protein